MFLAPAKTLTCVRWCLQSEALDTKLTVTDTMVNAAPLAKINDIKALLGRMMFSGKAMDKKVPPSHPCPLTRNAAKLPQTLQPLEGSTWVTATLVRISQGVE